MSTFFFWVLFWNCSSHITFIVIPMKVWEIISSRDFLRYKTLCQKLNEKENQSYNISKNALWRLQFISMSSFVPWNRSNLFYVLISFHYASILTQLWSFPLNEQRSDSSSLLFFNKYHVKQWNCALTCHRRQALQQYF